MEDRMSPRFRRQRTALLASCLLVGALAAAGCGALGLDDGSGGDNKKLVLAVETSPGDPLADMLQFFADEVEKRLGDDYEVEVFTGGAIGDETATVEGLRAGSIDAVVLGSDISALEPKFGILELSFLFEDRAVVTEFLDGELGQEMSDSLVDSAGLKVLSYGENGFRHITNNTRPVVDPGDLDGLKLRVPEVPARVKVFRSLGAVPTPMSIDEVYLGLDQGVIDGQENPLNVINAFSFFEKQKYLSLSGHTYSAASLTMNADRWASFPEDVQQDLQEAAEIAAEKSRAAGEKADSELVQTFEDAGVEVNEIDKEAFRAATKPIWEELRSEVGQEFSDKVFAELGIE
jgi:tripartite ATP-independent transporter DctP family solute receptor